jgi:tRNA dimethylallyltransferase
MDDLASSPELIVIGGPTGVGKTNVGVELALRLGGEIVSADSMQVYRRFRIGTAKPSAEEARGVPYHLVDFLEPGERFHLGAFIEMADRLIAEIVARKRRPIVVGGTGLYIKGLLQGVFESPEIDPAIRRRLRERAAAEGAPALHAELARVDPDVAATISPNDPVRVTRALEVWEQTGRPISALWREARGSQSAAPQSRYPYHLFVLTAERQALYERINRRVERMFRSGLAAEVERLVGEEGVSPESHAFKALGYRPVLDWVEGRASEREAVERMQLRSRQYAKRQLTWFRAMTGAVWIDVTNRPAAEVAREIRERVAQVPACTHTWFGEGSAGGEGGT